MTEEHRNLPIWGGVECTFNRVGDQFFDQLSLSGHDVRFEDLRTFASLGLRALRFPLLWERTSPCEPSKCDFSWAAPRLEFLRQSAMVPIVGLAHHGSGPAYTDLLDPTFGEKLANYAGQVAKRFPWVVNYTPVNEPLTTARFSGLYGFWYPHHRSDSSFARAFVNQCRAIALSMKAIRRVNPEAKLVQTEDFGKARGVPALAYQCEFENQRRWLTWDLLRGEVGREHPLWKFLLGCGIAEQELYFFHEEPCAPDLLGINHYVTSNRFLDDRTELYPPTTHGTNGRHRYADVEQVRVCGEDTACVFPLLQEIWERYRCPMAITEVHLGCTREEQLRWFCEVLSDAQKAKDAGVDVTAVTAWALLGSFDWDSLVTRRQGHYEAGVFDIRAGNPRPTLLGKWIQNYTSGGDTAHPLLQSQGWWRREDRFFSQSPSSRPACQSKSRPLLITGARGTLGRAFAQVCEQRGISYIALPRETLDIADKGSIETSLDVYKPWAIVNAAGYVRVDDAERDWQKCYRENVLGPSQLSLACRAHGIPLVTYSTDLVFGGDTTSPYLENSLPQPLSVYGRCKLEAEQKVSGYSDAIVIRTSAFFGPWDRHNFVEKAMASFERGEQVVAAGDTFISPTYVPNLVSASLDLLSDGANGLWHLTNPAQVSWADFARQIATAGGMDPKLVGEVSMSDMALPARRPKYSALASERGIVLDPLNRAVDDFFRNRGRF